MNVNQAKAQATIEFTVAFTVLLIFLFGSMQLFVWFNKNLVQRQENYEWTRGLAGHPDVMHTQNPLVSIGLGIEDPYLNGDFVRGLNRNMAKEFVVNKFYIDENEITNPIDRVLYERSKSVATTGTIYEEVRSGNTRQPHKYEKFKMFPGPTGDSYPVGE